LRSKNLIPYMRAMGGNPLILVKVGTKSWSFILLGLFSSFNGRASIPLDTQRYVFDEA